MPSTSVNGVVFPQDEGTDSNLADSHDRDSAGMLGMLARLADSKYILDGTLTFSNISSTSADLSPGVAALPISNVVVQSGSQNSYDTTLRNSVHSFVATTETITLSSMDSDTTNDVYISYDESSQDSITITYGSNVSTPSYPYIKIATVDTSNGNVSRANDRPVLRGRELKCEKYTANDGTTYDLVNDLVNDTSGGGNIGRSESGYVMLPGSSGDDSTLQVPVAVESGETVYTRSVTLQLPDGTTDSDVVFELIDPSGSGVGSVPLDSDPKHDDSPGISWENTGTSTKTAILRVRNGSSTDYTSSSSAADAVGYSFTWETN